MKHQPHLCSECAQNLVAYGISYWDYKLQTHPSVIDIQVIKASPYEIENALPGTALAQARDSFLQWLRHH